MTIDPKPGVYTLYYRPGSCALAPHILLYHVALEFEAVDAPRDETYRAINPNGQVPALALPDGFVLTQADAVLQHIASVADRGDMLGSGSERAAMEVHRWSAFLTGDFHPAFWPVFRPERFTASASKSDLSDLRDAGQSMVRMGLDQIETRLSNSRFLAGEELTLVDFYAVPMLRWAKLLMSTGLTAWPAAEAHYFATSSMPAAREAFLAQGIDP